MGTCINVVSSLSYSSFLCVGHGNVNNLSNKVNHIKNLLEDNKVDILCVSETWLRADVFDSTVNIPGYSCFILILNIRKLIHHVLVL